MEDTLQNAKKLKLGKPKDKLSGGLVFMFSWLEWSMHLCSLPSVTPLQQAL